MQPTVHHPRVLPHHRKATRVRINQRRQHIRQPIPRQPHNRPRGANRHRRSSHDEISRQSVHKPYLGSVGTDLNSIWKLSMRARLCITREGLPMPREPALAASAGMDAESEAGRE